MIANLFVIQVHANVVLNQWNKNVIVVRHKNQDFVVQTKSIEPWGRIDTSLVVISVTGYWIVATIVVKKGVTLGSARSALYCQRTL